MADDGDAFTPNTDELVRRNRSYAETFDSSALEVHPTLNLALVTCMDSRIDPLEVLGLENGQAHIIRNAGGIVTDDAIRSLCLSQRYLGTREIILLHHSDCGLHGLDEAAFRADLEEKTGLKPSWALEAFADPYQDVRQSMARIANTPFIPFQDHVRGFVYDVTDGLVKEVDTSDAG